MIRRPPRSTLFPYRRSSDLTKIRDVENNFAGDFVQNVAQLAWTGKTDAATLDRKSTRLNSSHSQISYAVFCLKKKKENTTEYSLVLPDGELQHCSGTRRARH